MMVEKLNNLKDILIVENEPAISDMIINNQKHKKCTLQN